MLPNILPDAAYAVSLLIGDPNIGLYSSAVPSMSVGVHNADQARKGPCGRHQ